MSKLPDKIVLYCRNADKDGHRHTFPVNPESEARHETARKWASNTHYGGKPNKYDVYEYDNTGFDHVVINNLEYRGEGGRAYQAIIHRDGRQYRVDLREPALVDIIKNAGIQAGGRLNGTYAFIVEGSQIHLVREGSDAWKKAEEASKQIKVVPNSLKKTDLKVGHVYETLSGDKSIYLGDFYMQGFKGKYSTDELNGKVEKQMLFFKIPSWRHEETLEDFVNGKIDDSTHYRFEVRKSHSFKYDRGPITNMPADMSKHTKDMIAGSYNRQLQHCNNPGHYGVSWDSLLALYRLIEMSSTKILNTDQAKLQQIESFRSAYSRQYGRRW